MGKLYDSARRRRGAWSRLGLVLAVALPILLAAAPALAFVESPPPVPPGLSPQASAQLQLTRASLESRHDALLSRLSAHYSRCGFLRDRERGPMDPCQQSRFMVDQAIADYQVALSAYRIAIDNAPRLSKPATRPPASQPPLPPPPGDGEPAPK